MQGVNLYELGEVYRDLRSRLDEEESPDATVAAIFETIEDAIENKVEVAFKLAIEAEATAEAIKAEEARLNAKRKAAENRCVRLREYVRDAMVVAGIRQVKRPVFSVSLIAAKPSLVIDNLDIIPALFVKTEVVKTPNKAELKKALLTENTSIPGCHIDPGKPSIQVR